MIVTIGGGKVAVGEAGAETQAESIMHKRKVTHIFRDIMDLEFINLQTRRFPFLDHICKRRQYLLCVKWIPADLSAHSLLF